MHSKKMNEAETGLAKRTASISFDRRITREEMERETDRHKLLLHQSLSSLLLLSLLLLVESGKRTREGHRLSVWNNDLDRIMGQQEAKEKEHYTRDNTTCSSSTFFSWRDIKWHLLSRQGWTRRRRRNTLLSHTTFLLSSCLERKETSLCFRTISYSNHDTGSDDKDTLLSSSSSSSSFLTNRKNTQEMDTSRVKGGDDGRLLDETAKGKDYLRNEKGKKLSNWIVCYFRFSCLLREKENETFVNRI